MVLIGLEGVGRAAHRAVLVAALGCTASLCRGDGTGELPVGTTLEDFFLPGTQPDPSGLELTPFFRALDNCSFCHGNFVENGLTADAEPYRNWAGSMMAHSARDPVSWAAITIANQDADFGGDLCLRCHSPAGWLGGRSVPTDGSALLTLPNTADFEGVTCHVCHRLVDPIYSAGESPVEDVNILDDLDVEGDLPAHHGNAQYVIDPEGGRRRGPFDLTASPPPHAWLQSPFHKSSRLCATCHDVSNPAYTRQGDGTYELNTLDLAASDDPSTQFPIERTYSEWLNSEYATVNGVVSDGRFGCPPDEQTQDITCRSCQDCHMPDRVSPGCIFLPPPHDDMPAHFLNGGNTWVIRAVDHLYTDGDPVGQDPVFIDDNDPQLSQAFIDDAVDRVTQMLRNASDLEVTQLGSKLQVRVINQSGHKLPTGYPEGRRMWLNVMYFDDSQQLITEHGAYDWGTAELTTSDTKVYETKLGIDAAVAKETGLPEGESFHFILNNVRILDNRIPPRGYTGAAFTAAQAEPVGYAYPDGQYWDDTLYAIPYGAAEAVVTLYYQTTSREYIEFLRDENATDTRGQTAYDQWVLHGRSAPVDMDSLILALDPAIPGDINDDGIVDVNDLLGILGAWGPCPAPCPPNCYGDTDGDCQVAILDLLAVLGNWSSP